MNFSKASLLFLSTLSINSSLMCYTAYLRNHHPTDILDATVMIQGGSDITAYKIMPGEERSMNIYGYCNNGMRVRRWQTNNTLAEWTWAGAHSPYTGKIEVGDRKPCGSNVWIYSPSGRLSHLDVGM